MKSKKLYSSKQIWKIILSVVALLIIGISLWYTSQLASDIQEDERLRVKLWSETVKKQAELVNLTTQTFEQLKAEERDNINDYSLSLKESEREQNDYTFLIHFLSKPINTPTIIESVDQVNGKITHRFGTEFTDTRGEITPEKRLIEDSLRNLCEKWDSLTEPIKVRSKLSTSYQIIHLGTSKLFGELKIKSDSLITSFENDLVSSAASIPILYLDSATGEIRKTVNIDNNRLKDSTAIERTVTELKQQNSPISINFGEGNTGYIYYAESNLLKQLKFYPWVQLVIILLFLMVSYFLFSTFRKAEQNQVWAGMAKETAHQLGTPLSSLMAWLEIIKADGVPDSSIQEMNKDIKRLNTITDRFSKIGSDIKTTEENIYSEIGKSIEYLRSRVSKKVALNLEGDEFAIAKINPSLFEWVIENLTKNAIDAIQGEEGSITYLVRDDDKRITIDITDTGKGISSSNFKSIFNPGFSTKERGWGLGLSLVKRIVEEQLKGKIWVHQSKIDQGTTFRITLKK